jgi:hypothetical protein
VIESIDGAGKILQGLVYGSPVMSRVQGDDQRTARGAGSLDFGSINSQDPFPVRQCIPDLGRSRADLRQRPVEIYEVTPRTLPRMTRELESGHVGVVERLGETQSGEAAFRRLVLRWPHEQVHILV